VGRYINDDIKENGYTAYLPSFSPIVTYVEVEVFMAVAVKIIFWDGMLCSLGEIHQCSGEMYCLYLQGQATSKM
jgi:hypothetical protein